MAKHIFGSSIRFSDQQLDILRDSSYYFSSLLLSLHNNTDNSPTLSEDQFNFLIHNIINFNYETLELDIQIENKNENFLIIYNYFIAHQILILMENNTPSLLEQDDYDKKITSKGKATKYLSKEKQLIIIIKKVESIRIWLTEKKNISAEDIQDTFNDEFNQIVSNKNKLLFDIKDKIKKINHDEYSLALKNEMLIKERNQKEKVTRNELSELSKLLYDQLQKLAGLLLSPDKIYHYINFYHNQKTGILTKIYLLINLLLNPSLLTESNEDNRTTTSPDLNVKRKKMLPKEKEKERRDNNNNYLSIIFEELMPALEKKIKENQNFLSSGPNLFSSKNHQKYEESHEKKDCSWIIESYPYKQ